MRQYLLILLSLILLFFASIHTSNYTKPVGVSEKMADLKKYTKTIKSINPDDTDFKDLEFLKTTLKDKSVVMLGEQTHFDGATFLAKARLVKFLHQELGFDVLVYEAGLYDTENLWNDLKRSASTDKKKLFSRALYPFWTANKENEALLNYIINNLNTEKEIQIAGLDVQLSGMIQHKERDSILTEYLNSKNQITEEKFPSFYGIKDQHSKFVNKIYANALSEGERDSILTDIGNIKQIISSRDTLNVQDSLYFKFFENLETLYDYSWKYEWKSDRRFHIRDSAMAQNFIWLKENKFKNRKVIIWASNMHTSYNNKSYTSPPKDFVSMGEYIKNKYKEDCYSISFTSFASENKSENSDELYNNKTVEYLLHQLNTPYVFFDFNKIDNASFLKEKTMMNLNQKMSFEANWNTITDGVFYIDTMTRLNKLEK